MLVLAHLLAYHVVVTTTIQPPVVHSAEGGLDEIVARLEWYDTSIQSFRIRYKIIREPHPSGRRQMNMVLGRTGPHAEHWVEQRDDVDEEFLSSGDKVRVEHVDHTPAPGVEDQAVFVWIGDGKEMRSLASRSDGTPTHGGVAEDFAKGRIPYDSPTLVAGMRYSSRKRALYQEIKEGRLKLKGEIKEKGHVLYYLSSALSDNESDRTDLYLDSSHMYLPIRSERWLRGKVSNRMTVGDFARFADTATTQERWFPSQITREDFFEGQITTTHKITCQSFEINTSIPDGLFELNMPGGVLVSNAQTHDTRLHGSEEQRQEFASKQAVKAKEEMDSALAKAASSQRTVSPPSRLPWMSFGIGLLGAALILVGVAIRRGFFS